MQEKTNTFSRIYEIVKQVPKGKVSTYGEIAALCGNPRLSRVVGYALHSNPEPGVIPCHRIVNRFGETSGSFAFGGSDVQRKLLEDEGVKFDSDGKVLLEKFIWSGEID
jgi:methylated-DNA-protein-cysteine methyltransferase-like protein